MLNEWKKRALLSAFGFVAALAILEVGLRVLGLNNPVLYESDPVAGYRLKPNKATTFFGTEILINQLGVRDSRNFESEHPDKTRILVLGDSVTWGGVRIAQSELFTQRLESKLTDAEVINAGVNGYSVWQMAALYRAYLRVLNPDIVVLYVIPGDFYRAPVVDIVRPNSAFPLKRPMSALTAALASARVLLASRLGWDWLRPPNPVEPREHLDRDERAQRNIEAVLRLAEDLRPNQKLVVVVSPSPEHPNNPPLPSEVDVALESAKISLWKLNGGEMLDKRNFVDHIHLSPLGHARVAANLADRLQNMEGS